MENSLFLNEKSSNIDPLKLLFSVVLIAIAKRVEPLLSRKIHIDVGKQIQKETCSSSILFCAAVFISITDACSLKLQFTFILNDPEKDLSI